MARLAAIVCAVVAGLGAALLLTSGPTVVVDGERWSCPGVIVTAEAGAGIPGEERSAGAQPCERVQERWTWYAAGLGVISLVAGTGAMFYRRETAQRGSGLGPVAVTSR